MTVKYFVPLVLGVAALAGISGFAIGRTQVPSDVRLAPLHPAVGKAFDGDTILLNGQVIKIRGLDAPEVATNASCLAEAALGGLAQQFVGSELNNFGEYSWKLKNVEKVNDRFLGDLVRSDGENFVDVVTINGYGIASDARWDWCRRTPNFDDNKLYPAINVSSGPPQDVRVADD